MTDRTLRTAHRYRLSCSFHRLAAESRNARSLIDCSKTKPYLVGVCKMSAVQVTVSGTSGFGV